MNVGLAPEHIALRDRLRAYYAELLTPEVEAVLADPHRAGGMQRDLARQMAADGWLGIGWPIEYGGGGATPIEQQIFFDESMRAGAPVPLLALNTVGPTIMQFGTPEQKAFYLPRILAGEGGGQHPLPRVTHLGLSTSDDRTPCAGSYAASSPRAMPCSSRDRTISTPVSCSRRPGRATTMTAGERSSLMSSDA